MEKERAKGDVHESCCKLAGELQQAYLTEAVKLGIAAKR